MPTTRPSWAVPQVAVKLDDREGKRPSVDTRRPEIQVAVHLKGGEVTFFLDVAGVPLHRRGWRRRLPVRSWAHPWT